MDNSLSDVISAIIERSTNQDEIMPSWVANAAYLELDPDELSPLRVKVAALLTFKQIARQLLRGKFEPQDDKDALQHELWPDLQQRYPSAHQTSDAEPTYVKLELLTDADIQWNVKRLRLEAATKIKHANALEQWGLERGLKAA